MKKSIMTLVVGLLIGLAANAAVLDLDKLDFSAGQAYVVTAIMLDGDADRFAPVTPEFWSTTQNNLVQNFQPLDAQAPDSSGPPVRLSHPPRNYHGPSEVGWPHNLQRY